MQLNACAFVALVASVCVANVAAADEKAAITELPRPEVTIHLPDGEKAGRVLISPDGSKVAVASRDGGTLRLFDARRGSLEQTLRGHKKDITSLAFSPDGKQLVTGGFDGTVRIWNASSGVEVRRVQLADDAFVAVAVSPDGKMLAIGHATVSGRLDSPLGKSYPVFDYNGALQVQGLADGKVVPEFKSGGKAVFAVAYSPDGKTLAVERYSPIDLWDTTSRSITRTLDNDGTSTIAFLTFSRDGRSLFTENSGACSWAVAWEWNVAGERAPIQFLGPDGGSPSAEVFVLADNRTILARAENGINVFDRQYHTSLTAEQERSESFQTTATFERENRRRLGILGCGKTLHIDGIDVSSDAKSLVASLDDGTVRIWNLAAALKPILDGRR